MTGGGPSRKLALGGVGLDLECLTSLVEAKLSVLGKNSRLSTYIVIGTPMRLLFAPLSTRFISAVI